jgi:hypothetical protein
MQLLRVLPRFKSPPKENKEVQNAKLRTTPNHAPIFHYDDKLSVHMQLTFLTQGKQ